MRLMLFGSLNVWRSLGSNSAFLVISSKQRDIDNNLKRCAPSLTTPARAHRARWNFTSGHYGKLLLTFVIDNFCEPLNHFTLFYFWPVRLLELFGATTFGWLPC
eukprot:3618318-Pyramimonas_sp.AAC.1